VEKAVLDYAKKNSIDLIVIGTSGVEEYFVGSVGTGVIHHAGLQDTIR
jgi:nucleotide-binding universal stress UspA family protein